MPDAITEMRVAPFDLALDVPGVWLDEQLVRVEAVAALGLVRAVHAIAVEQAGARFGQIAVPRVVRAFLQLDSLQLAAAGAVEDAELDFFGVLGEEGEVDAFAVEVGPAGIGA